MPKMLVYNYYKYAVIIIAHITKTLGRPGSPPLPPKIPNVECLLSQSFICGNTDTHLLGAVTKRHSHFTGSGQLLSEHLYRRMLSVSVVFLISENSINGVILPTTVYLSGVRAE